MSNPADEVVAIRFKTASSDRIVFNRDECLMRIQANEPFELITRQRMQLMAAADLGPQWERAAQAPTLFLKSEIGGA